MTPFAIFCSIVAVIMLACFIAGASMAKERRAREQAEQAKAPFNAEHKHS
ncbi:hypothetical protein [Stenoxybacter acetivorans]|nr:hypothetical protein [Stenoxybacter acetivorans]